MSDASPCVLCDQPSDAMVAVPPRSDEVSLCATCGPMVRGEADLDATHLFCLQGAVWSEEPAVQVVAVRLLRRLREHAWAADLLDQVYLDDDTAAWVDEGQEARSPTLDSNGTPLADGDSVTLIKDLDVKGANFTAKRGTMVKNIRLGDDPGLVEGRVNKTAIYLKTEVLKKA